jgi:hypothetical protein
MWPTYAIIAIGAVFLICILAAVVWGLTRAADRIQMATACLVVCGIGYVFAAMQLYSREGLASSLGILVGGYVALLYVVVGALAIYYKRWAWKAAIGAFALHLALTVFLVSPLLQAGTTGLVALGQWLFFGALGLWACLHRGSRELVSLATHSDA